VKFVVKD